MTTPPPLCRCCGKPIKKRTGVVYLEEEATQYQKNSSHWRYVVIGDQPWPRSKADCQRHTNGIVSAVEYHTYYDDNGKEQRADKVRRFWEWDGETYDPCYGFFCTNTCAADFGHMAAQSGKVNSVAYVDALKRQREQS